MLKSRRVLVSALAGIGLLAGAAGLAFRTSPATVANAGERIEVLAVREHHPKIHAGLEALRAARAELRDADHDFNGHRVAAIAAVDEAIKQLEICLAVDHK